MLEPDDFASMKQALEAEPQKKFAQINPERWQRIRNGAILFSDIVEDLTGKRGSMISCPFHGRDQTPSFAIYPPSQGNCGYCFGCSKTYDAFKFVQEFESISAYKALVWLEERYELPALDEPEEDEEDEEETVQIELADLIDPFVIHVRDTIRNQPDAALAEEYMQIFYAAQRNDDPLSLARVLGHEALERISMLRSRRQDG